MWRNVRTITMSHRQEILDYTAMGSSGRKRLFGLKDVSLSIEFNQEYSTGASLGAAQNSLDYYLNSYLGKESSAVWISIKPTTATCSKSNPRYAGRYMLESFNPMSGMSADLGVVTANFIADGNIARKTTGL
jgi:hypothetical protein